MLHVINCVPSSDSHTFTTTINIFHIPWCLLLCIGVVFAFLSGDNFGSRGFEEHDAPRGSLQPKEEESVQRSFEGQEGTAFAQVQVQVAFEGQETPLSVQGQGEGKGQGQEEGQREGEGEEEARVAAD